MSLELALIAAVVAGVVVWQLCAALLRPRVAVTVQKTTNTNDQPEVVTLQASVWRTQSHDRLFRVLSDLADAAWARMYHVNLQILERNREMAAEIDRRRAAQEQWKSRASRAQRRHIAKELGIPLRDLTQADIDRYLAPRAASDAPDAAAEPVG